MPKKSGLRPENKGGYKNRKKVVFWHKKSENFRIRHPKKKSQIFFNPPMRPKRHFALKDTFPIETIVKKKTSKFLKFSTQNSTQKSKKYFFSRRLGIFFLLAPAAPLFFQQENEFPEKVKKKLKKNSQVNQNRGDQTFKFPHS